MRSQLRFTSIAKWICALLLLSIVACWVFAATLGIDLWESHSFLLGERQLRIFLWPSPRSSGDPDCWTIPLGVLAALVALPTLALYWIDRHAARASLSSRA